MSEENKQQLSLEAAYLSLHALSNEKSKTIDNLQATIDSFVKEIEILRKEVEELKLKNKTLAQDTIAFMKDFEQLRVKHESALDVLNRINLQECGKLLSVGLGQDIPNNIVPKIKELKAEVEKIKVQNNEG